MIWENLKHYWEITNTISFYCPMLMFHARESLHGCVSQADPAAKIISHFCSPLTENINIFTFKTPDKYALHTLNRKELLRIL